MVTMVEIGIVGVILLGFVIGFRFFGRMFPVVPKLNDWPITAIIFEQRTNLLLPRVEPARSIRNRQGDWFFELKKTGMKTPPKKLKDIYSDISGKNFIFLRQLTRETVEPIKIDYVEDPDLIKLKIQEEQNVQLERYRQRELIRKHSKGPTMLQIYLPLGMVVVALIGVAIYFTIISDPILEAQAAYQANTNAMTEATKALTVAIKLLAGGG